MKRRHLLAAWFFAAAAVMFPASVVYGITCAQGSRFSGWAGSQFCPSCSVHTATGRSAKSLKGIALLVASQAKRELAERRPDVASAIALLEWNGRRDGLMRDEEVVVSFLGAPTPRSASFIRANGPMSAFDETFAALPDGQWLRVSMSLRPHSDQRRVDAVVLTTLQVGEQILSASEPVILSGLAVTATVDDVQGGSEPILVVELSHLH